MISNFNFQIGGFKSKSGFEKSNSERICQDDFFVYEDPKNHFKCISVADGAGSAAMSDVGAALVTRRICTIINRNFDIYFDLDPYLVKKYIIHALRTSLGKIARQKNTTIKALASTLLFVAIKNDKIIGGHIGDGLILYNKFNKIIILSEPENGEFSNQTYFVTSGYYQHHLRLYKGILKDISAFYLMTDGISNLIFNRITKTISNNFIESVESFRSNTTSSLNISIEKYLKEEVIKFSKDDSTLVIMQIQNS